MPGELCSRCFAKEAVPCRGTLDPNNETHGITGPVVDVSFSLCEHCLDAFQHGTVLDSRAVIRNIRRKSL